MDPRSPKKSALEGLTRPYKAYKAQIAQDTPKYNAYYMLKGLKRFDGTRCKNSADLLRTPVPKMVQDSPKNGPR